VIPDLPIAQRFSPRKALDLLPYRHSTGIFTLPTCRRPISWTFLGLSSLYLRVVCLPISLSQLSKTCPCWYVLTVFPFTSEPQPRREQSPIRAPLSGLPFTTQPVQTSPVSKEFPSRNDPAFLFAILVGTNFFVVRGSDRTEPTGISGESSPLGCFAALPVNRVSFLVPVAVPRTQVAYPPGRSLSTLLDSFFGRSLQRFSSTVPMFLLFPPINSLSGPPIRVVWPIPGTLKNQQVSASPTSWDLPGIVSSAGITTSLRITPESFLPGSPSASPFSRRWAGLPPYHPLLEPMPKPLQDFSRAHLSILSFDHPLPEIPQVAFGKVGLWVTLDPQEVGRFRSSFYPSLIRRRLSGP